MVLYIVISILALVSGMVGIWKNWETGSNFLIPSSLSVILIASLAYNGYEHYQALRKEKYTKTWGTFNFPTDNKTEPTFFKGQLGLTVVFKNDDWATEDKWQVWVVNGKINISGTVRDYQGDIVFQIDGTVWKNWSGKDFNYDERAMEVKDSMGRIIFQLEFDKEKNTITAFGILHYGDERVLLMGKKGTETVIGRSPENNSKIALFLKSMKPIFRYPREEHLGERA